jgi:hypothetical protein
MAKYAALVASASEGAVTTGARMTAALNDSAPRTQVLREASPITGG